jgi:hypothetical protein
MISGYDGGFNTTISRRCIQFAMVQCFEKQTTELFVERRGGDPSAGLSVGRMP